MTYAKKNARQRGQYGTQPEAPGHRTSGGFGGPADRSEGPMTYRAKLVRGHGAHGGTHRISYSRETGGALIIGKSDWTPINEVEFQRLQGETLSVTFHDGDQRVERLLRKFSFETLDGQPVSLAEIPDRPVANTYTL